eukprot:3424904-Rhodomonas_salina.1
MRCFGSVNLKCRLPVTRPSLGVTVATLSTSMTASDSEPEPESRWPAARADGKSPGPSEPEAPLRNAALELKFVEDLVSRKLDSMIHQKQAPGPK